MRTVAPVAVVAIAVLLLLLPPRVPSCGVWVTAAFTRARDFSVEDAARGRWEVLLPGFRRQSLVLAYRYMTGLRLDEDERKAFASSSSVAFPDRTYSGRDRWRDARANAGLTSRQDYISGYRRHGERALFYHNCLEDTFQTAATTLTERTKLFGPNSRAVVDWARAQDMVFQNCSEGPPVIPPAAPADLPPLIRADRAYQIAAANFYAGRFEDAERMFREIARDESSPWRTLAPYLAVRCIVRRATLREGAPDVALLTQSRIELLRILSDKSLAPMHEPARKLLAFIAIRLEPEERFLATARHLTARGQFPDLPQTLVDYLYLLGRIELAGDDSITRMTAQDDLTDWVLTFQGRRTAPRDHAYGKWEATSSLPWLVAAISAAQAGDPRVEELLAAAEAVGAGSPAFPTAAFHSVRLLSAGGREDEARQKLDALLSRPAGVLSPSFRNLLLAARMKLARSFEEFLRNAPRLRTGTEDYGGYRPPAEKEPAEWLFDTDAAAVLSEQLPVSLLGEAGASTLLPGTLRREIILAAWSRAVLLDDHRASAGLAGAVIAMEPLLKPDLSRYRAAAGPEDRAFTAALAMLRSPGLNPTIRPNVLRDAQVNRRATFRYENWWCGAGAQPAYGVDYSPALRLLYPGGRAAPVTFLSQQDRMRAKEEWDRLSSLPPASTYLGERVVAYARAHRSDPRVPEALHLVVRASRYGCTDANTGSYSRQAFELLHRRYPKSPWTGQTPYWYR